MQARRINLLPVHRLLLESLVLVWVGLLLGLLSGILVLVWSVVVRCVWLGVWGSG